MTTDHIVDGVIVTDGSGPRTLTRPDGSLRDGIALAWLGAQRSPNTVAAYRRDLADWFTWCDDHGVDPLTARRFQVDAWRQDLISSGLAQTTVARKLTALSSFYSYAGVEAEQVVTKNPLIGVKRPRVADESTTVGLDLDEAALLIVTAAERDMFAHALMALMLATGLRVSEVCSATTADLAVSRGELTLVVTRKGEQRERILVPRVAAEPLREYLGARRGPLFLRHGKPVDRRHVDYLIKVLARIAGIDKRLSPHCLRHTAATMALDGGATLRKVQYMLGHKDPRTTIRYDRSRHRIDDAAGHTLNHMLSRSVGDL